MIQFGRIVTTGERASECRRRMARRRRRRAGTQTPAARPPHTPTGIETLASVGFGYAAAALGLLSRPSAGNDDDARRRQRRRRQEAAVDALNGFVVRCCLPCLQLWLLASRADLRAPGAWASLAAFSVWTLLVFAAAALWELRPRQQSGGGGGAAEATAARGGGRAAHLALHLLVLATNNTGVLGPVVLEAALGRAYAPLGPMATVALYFLQLPMAQALLALSSGAQGRRRRGAGDAEEEEEEEEGQRRVLVGDGERGGLLPLRSKDSGADVGGDGRKATETEMTRAAAAAANRSSEIEAATSPLRGGLGGLSRARAGEDRWSRAPAETAPREQPADAPLGAAAASRPAAAPPATAPRLFAAAVARNPLVWCTGIAVALSLLGSPRVLNPTLAGGGGGGGASTGAAAAPGAAAAASRLLAAAARLSVGWIDGFLGWFARCAAPLSLFATGAWLFLWQQREQQRRQTRRRGRRRRRDGGDDARAKGSSDGDGSDDSSSSSSEDDDDDDDEEDSSDASNDPALRRRLAAYLALRATACPAAMALVCAALRVPGRDLRAACVCLSLLPVAQTSFAVARDSGAASRRALATIGAALVASVVLLLPQMVATLWLFDRLGWLGAGGGAAAL